MNKTNRLTIRVSDIDRSVDFYSTKLGFRVLGRYGTRFAELESAGLTLMLHQRFEQQPATMPPGVMAISLQVADVDAVREHLESKGVVFEGETVELEGLRFAFTSDLDGIPIHLVQTEVFEVRAQ